MSKNLLTFPPAMLQLQDDFFLRTEFLRTHMTSKWEKEEGSPFAGSRKYPTAMYAHSRDGTVNNTPLLHWLREPNVLHTAPRQSTNYVPVNGTWQSILLRQYVQS